MKRSILFWLIFSTGILAGCKQDDEGSAPFAVEWTKLGLNGKNVRELRLSEGKLYAATDDGLYIRNLLEGAEWSEFGLAGREVRSLLVADSYMLASVVDPEAPALFRSDDEGSTWVEVNDNFGGEFSEPIYHLSESRNAGQIYGTGHAVVATAGKDDLSWTPIWNDWMGFATGIDFVEVNPHNGDVWAGGQNAIEGMVLLRSGDGGENWQQWHDLVEAPSVAKDILFDGKDAETVYAGFEGALIKTEDNGESWQTIIKSDENRFFFGVSQDPVKLNRIFAAGWLKRFDEPQPLILFVSENSGASWTEFEHEEEDFGGVNDMILTRESNQTVLYLALWKGGVYKVTIQN